MINQKKKVKYPRGAFLFVPPRKVDDQWRKAFSWLYLTMLLSKSTSVGFIIKYLDQDPRKNKITTRTHRVRQVGRKGCNIQ